MKCIYCGKEKTTNQDMIYEPCEACSKSWQDGIVFIGTTLEPLEQFPIPITTEKDIETGEDVTLYYADNNIIIPLELAIGMMDIELQIGERYLMSSFMIDKIIETIESIDCE